MLKVEGTFLNERVLQALSTTADDWLSRDCVARGALLKTSVRPRCGICCAWIPKVCGDWPKLLFALKGARIII